MSERKALHYSISALENKILEKRASLVRHKSQVHQFIHENRYLLLGILIPPFLAGWYKGKPEVNKKGKHKRRLKSFIQFMLKTAWSLIHFK